MSFLNIKTFCVINFLFVNIVIAQKDTNSNNKKNENPLPLAYPDTFVQSQLDDSKKNANNRIPLYIPNRCNENELFYPGDQKDDWICDCVPGFVYHPDNNKCYELYSRGPCKNKEYLVLKEKHNIPECERNSCDLDNRVPFRNRCYELHKPGPCRFPNLSYVVGVNVTTLKLDCVKQSANLQHINFEDRFDDETEVNKDINALILHEVIPICAKGSMRAINQMCSPSTAIYSNSTSEITEQTT